MIVFDFPVSGGSFVSQCAFVKIFSAYRIKPDIVTAGSGGNVPAYFGTIADWEYEVLYTDTKDLASDVIARKRYNNTLMNYILCLLHHKSLYGPGKGVKEILKRNIKNVCKTEIWTNCTKKSDNSSKLFCNVNKENSKIVFTSNCEPLYANGNVELISLYCSASCTIPTLLPDVKINGELYVDSGLSYASCLAKILLLTDKSIWKNCKLFIFSPFGVDFENGNRMDIAMFPLLHNAFSSLSSLIYSIYQKDKETIRNYLFTDPVSIELSIDILSSDDIKRYIDMEYSILFEVVNKSTTKVSITSFDHVSIQQKMSEIRFTDCKLRITFQRGSNTS